jgi:hypothetical protein
VNRRDTILELKSRIKALAADQKAEKLKRKGCPQKEMSDLWGRVYCRSAKITAHLNFYLAARGHEYRHNAPDKYLNKKYSDELAKEFALEVKA